MARTPYSIFAARGGGRRGVRPFAAGAIALVLILTTVYFVYTKANPFSSPYEFEAIFDDVNDMKRRSPVRIAGVTVGRVKSVEPLPDGSGRARVRMEVSEAGLPIKQDANLKVRSRLFLEGNYYVDLHPGTPRAPELESGGVIPPNQTASPVQFGEVLTALQRDTREDLRTFLKEFSRALDQGGAEGFNMAIRYWEPAYRDTALVNDATLGTEFRDLSRLLRGQGRAFGAIARDEEARKDLITNLNRTALAFAREDDALKATIPALRDVLTVGRPALRSLNSGLPSLSAFARDALPGARSSSPTLDAQIPFVRQARRLVSEAELKGLVRELRRTIPDLARLNRNQVRTLNQTRALSSCQNNVLLPFVRTPIPDPDFPRASGEPVFEVSQRPFVGLAGESRNADANSPFFRVQAGGGPFTIVSTGETGEQLFAQADFRLEGVRPARPSRRPVFRPNIPCETQEPPNLNAVGGPGDETVEPRGVATPESLAREERVRKEFRKLADHLERVAAGLPSVDPLAFDELGERQMLRRLKLVRLSDGTLAEQLPPKESDRTLDDEIATLER